MTDKSTTRKRRPEKVALDEDDILLQEDCPTKKPKDFVEDEEELDEEALLGNSDEEENLDDAGLTNEQNYKLEEEEDPVCPPRLNEQVDASEGLQVSDDTGDNLDVDVPDNSQVNDLNVTGENQSFALQPSTTDPTSLTSLTTTKSEKPKPSPPREEETSIVVANTTGPEEDKEEEDTENNQEQTKGNTQDTEETSESEEEKEDEDGRGGRFRSERQTVPVSLKSSRTRNSLEISPKQIEDRQQERYGENLPHMQYPYPNQDIIIRQKLPKPRMSPKYAPYPPPCQQQQQQMSQSWSSTPSQQQHQVAVSSAPPRASSPGWGHQQPHQGSLSSILTNFLKSDCKMVKLFDICYCLAKNGIPFSYYPTFVNQEKRHGVDLGSMNQKPVLTDAFTFTKFLAEDIRTDVDEAVRKARYISILIDGSTDRSTLKKELIMYVKYLEDGIPRTRFFSILDVKRANADGILEAINTTFQQHNIPDWKSNLIGFCFDGASVNFGFREGVVAKLAAEMAWLVGIHCIAHQLDLVAKDAFKDSFFSKEIDPIVTSLPLCYVRADGTLWVKQRKRALQLLEMKYPLIVACLTERGMDKGSKMKNAAAKARGMVEKMSSYKFVLHMALYIDLLEELSHAFQRNDICLSRFIEHLETAKSVLTDMADGQDGAKLQSIKRSCVEGTYQGVALSGMEDGSAEFDAARNDLVQPLVTCIGQKCSLFTENDVFSAVSSFDPQTWPYDLKGFDFSDRDAQILIEHFEDTLVAHGCDPNQAKSEWVRLKKIIQIYYKPTTTWQALWGTLFQKRQEDFPNFLHIIEMIQVLPFATGKVKRGFFLMDKMQSDWRVHLKRCMLDDLMMINLEGPSEEEYNTSSAVARWCRDGKQSRRPYVQPYDQQLADSMYEGL